MIILVVSLTIGFRTVILLSGQKHLRSDEAVVGLMAKHIVTKNERPLFLYGQPYGGGHAIAAYLTAPFFAIFGTSSIILRSVTLILSIINAIILCFILQKYFNNLTAVLGLGLYAFSPPVVYQSFLINGSTESLCLSLLSLLFFLKATAKEQYSGWNLLVAGFLSGMAYYAFDYGLLYALVYLLLLLGSGPKYWKSLIYFCAGLLVGTLPITLYNITHDFISFRFLLDNATHHKNLFLHIFQVLWCFVSHDLAAFLTGEIDDYKYEAIGMGTWLHAFFALLSIGGIIISYRFAVIEYVRNFFTKKASPNKMPLEIIPLLFIVMYLIMYSLSKFSTFSYKTPRYLLPLCPFLSIVIATFVSQIKKSFWKNLFVVICLILICTGAYSSFQLGMRPWHEEHKIRTSGEEITKLAKLLLEKNIRIAYAPYEVQWRVMFETDERVIVADDLFSPLNRYPAYSLEVKKRIMAGEPFALILRKDFAFEKLFAPRDFFSDNIIRFYNFNCKLDDLNKIKIEGTNEFNVFYPLFGKSKTSSFDNT